MLPTPLPPRRRAARRTALGLLSTTASSALVLGLLPTTASALPTTPCVADVCTATFTDTGSLQHFTVPDGVTSITATVRGAAAGTPDGGLGGSTVGTLPVQPGEDLTMLVGASAQGVLGGFAGGGAGGQAIGFGGDDGHGGGGGSFVFDESDSLLLAAGGGGGAGVDALGGAGAGATKDALPGATAGALGGGAAATTLQNGAGGLVGSVGLPGTPVPGTPGTGTTLSSVVLPVGGSGGSGENGAGGGGGGFHAGGGGSSWTLPLPFPFVTGAGGGGGGAGYADPEVTDVVGATGVQEGAGVITLTWNLVKQGLSFTSVPGTDLVVGDVYQVKGVSTTANLPLDFSLDPATTTNDACTVEGDQVTLQHAGSCGVALEQAADLSHVLTRVVQTFEVHKAPQAITFAPLPANAPVRTDLPLDTVGGGSSAPVVLEIGAGSVDVCRVDAGRLVLTGIGDCVVRATQLGDADHLDAAPISQTVAVSALSTSTSLTLSTSSTVYGEQVGATARVAGLALGSVQFGIDGQDVGQAVVLGQDRTATLPALLSDPSYPTPGSHLVSARFLPLDLTVFGTSSDEAPLSVSKAGSTSVLTVAPGTLSSVVTPVAPGRGVPTGLVTFRVGSSTVGTAVLVNGRATLSYQVPADNEAKISASYAGDLRFLASSDATAGPNPLIAASLSSTVEKSATGWYRKPVTVTFTCTPKGSPLTADCPSPVTLSNDGGGQSLARTIRAEDGGIATVVVSGINIDQAAPRVGILGAKAGDRFFATAPTATCDATDTLSSVVSCTAKSKKKGSKVTYTVTAVDGAGNSASAKFSVKTYSYGIVDAPYSSGAYTVNVGSGYTLVAKSSSRPRLVKAVKSSKTPKKVGAKFTKTGKNTWSLGLPVDSSYSSQTYWKVGIKTGKKVHVIKIRVIS